MVRPFRRQYVLERIALELGDIRKALVTIAQNLGGGGTDDPGQVEEVEKLASELGASTDKLEKAVDANRPGEPGTKE